MDETVGPSEKKHSVAFSLCLFLGMLGAHRFYVGKIGTGVLTILTGGGGGGLWPLYDLIRIYEGNFKDKQGRPLISEKQKAQVVQEMPERPIIVVLAVSLWLFSAFKFLGVALLGFGIPMVASGVIMAMGLLKRKQWAWVLQFIASGCMLFILLGPHGRTPINETFMAILGIPFSIGPGKLLMADRPVLIQVIDLLGRSIEAFLHAIILYYFPQARVRAYFGIGQS